MNSIKEPGAVIIREARIRLGLSQQDVATRIGVHIRQYQRLEYGERPLSGINMQLGLSVCAVLKLDPYDIVPINKPEIRKKIRPQPNREK